MKQYKQILLYSFCIALLAQLYYQPYPDTDFFISPGVICLSAVMLIRPEIPPLGLCSMSAVFTSAMRIPLLLSSHTAQQSVEIALSIFLFYVVFGLITQLMQSFDPARRYFGVWLVFADCAGNCAEFLILGNWRLSNFRMLLLLAVWRAGTSYLVYLFYKRSTFQELQRVRLNELARLSAFSSGIYAYEFYLYKDCQSIERLTGDALLLYEQLPQGSDEARRALGITQELHEVKKDMQRTVHSMKQLNELYRAAPSMSLGQICEIVRISCQDMAGQAKLKFQCKEECEISHFLDHFVILNNLVSNALQAHASRVEVTLGRDGDAVRIEVRDDGPGIPEQELPHIFLPGFSTKFNERSGELSSGVGLTHVQDIVKRAGGQVEVESRPGCTVFSIRLPLAESEALEHD